MAARLGHLPQKRRLLWAIPMRRWTSTIGALLLVLMLWTGAAGHAAELVECSPTSAEYSDHVGDDGDSRSDDRGGKAAHYHLGCSGHCVATSSDGKTLPARPATSVTTFDRQIFWRAGDEPALTLRPPIA